jgi:hypothetical protein
MSRPFYGEGIKIKHTEFEVYVKVFSLGSDFFPFLTCFPLNLHP